MKLKILLLLLIASTGLFSCKKDKQPAPDQLTVIKKEILATWQITASKEVYYNSAGAAVKTESSEVTNAKVQFVDESKVRSLDPPVKDYSYSLTNVNGKIIMTMEEVSYEVSINNDTMTWSIEQEIKDNEYSKLVATFQFKKVN